MAAATELKSQNNLLQQKLNEATKQLERCAIVNDKLKQACRVHLQDMSARWSKQYTQKSSDIAQMFDAKYGPLQSRQTVLRERQQVMQVKFDEQFSKYKDSSVKKLETCTSALHKKEHEVSLIMYWCPLIRVSTSLRAAGAGLGLSRLLTLSFYAAW